MILVMMMMMIFGSSIIKDDKYIFTLTNYCVFVSEKRFKKTNMTLVLKTTEPSLDQSTM